MILGVIVSFAQVPTIQDCLGAIPICTEIYEEDFVPMGSGNYPNEVNAVGNSGGISCMDQEVSSIWYTFTVNRSGDFGFLLTPNDPDDDYDWALFNITDADCEDIFNNPQLQVSCNAAGGGGCNGLTGATNASSYANQGGGCEFFPPDQFSGFSPFNAFVPVQAGNTYVLLVSNWTESINGYTIDFGASDDLGIFDNAPPLIQAVQTPEDCDTSGVVFEFSENIQLNTVSADNFVLTGPGGPYTARVDSRVLQLGGSYDDRLEIHFDPPIHLPGTYEVEVILNNAAEILDLCDNQLDNPNTYSFEINNFPLTAPILPADTILCVGEALDINISSPEIDAYSWSTGDNSPGISIEEQGVYGVTITNTCGSVSSTFDVDLVNCGVCTVFVPSGLTPNGDGLNDVLIPFSDCILQDYSMKIFDRWGNMLFTSTDFGLGWNGKKDDQSMDNGVYTYVISYQVQEQGTVLEKVISGDVTLLK